MYGGGKGFFNAFILLPPENWPKKTAHRFLMCCRSAYDCWLLSKKEVVRRFFSMSAFYQYSRYFFETGCPNIFFFGLFRLFVGGEVWRGGSGKFVPRQMGVLFPCEWDYRSKLR
ncbi:MAG: hypothetical protein ACLRWH_11875 [Emergencia sp.]